MKLALLLTGIWILGWTLYRGVTAKRTVWRAPQESSWAFRQLMAKAAEDLTNGTDQPARVIHKGPSWKHTRIGPFQARLLRMKKRA